MKGTVARLVDAKGFGFINDGKNDYFFHRNDFTGHWNDLLIDFNRHEKIQVEFDGEKTAKGLRASNVRRLDWPNQSV